MIEVKYPIVRYLVMHSDIDEPPEHMYEWCRDHFGLLWAFDPYIGLNRGGCGSQIMLYTEEDALFFRLRWGGKLIWAK